MRLSRLSLAMLIAQPQPPIKGFYLPDARLTNDHIQRGYPVMSDLLYDILKQT